MTDDLDDFLELFGPPVPSKRPEPLPVAETEDDFSELLAYSTSDSMPVPVDDPEAALRALRDKFPDAQDALLEQAVRCAPVVEALLVEKTDRRVDVLLARFLRQGGTITSNERAEIKGHGAEWSRCRDIGFIIEQSTNKGAGGNLYTLRLDRLSHEIRNQRDFLTVTERRALFDFYGNACNLCGSHSDLQADHRVAVVLVGGAKNNLEAFQALCRTCNLNKRTACNKCSNEDPEVCRTCSWAYPENPTHTAREGGVLVTIRLSEDVLTVVQKRGRSPAEWVRSLILEATSRHASEPSTPA